MKKEKIIVALAGKIATGKTLVSKYLENKGFEIINIGNFFKELTYELFKSSDRDKMEYLSSTLEKYFPNFTGWFMISKIFSSNSDKIVIDSVREPREIELLKKFFDVKIICLYCDDEKRIQRILERASDKDPKTKQDIVEMFKKAPSERSTELIIEKGLFDLYIDTTNLSKDRVIELVEKFIDA